MRIDGLTDLMKNLETLQRNAQELDGRHHLTLRELFPDQFMTAYTDFGSMQEMLDASGFDGETEEEIKNIFSGQEWNDFVSGRTMFSSWQEMMRRGCADWTRERLHRGLK